MSDTFTARFSDGGGVYTVTVTGGVMTTTISNYADTVHEVMTDTVHRAPRYDATEHSDWMLTDEFASCPDYGERGVVWVNGEAYTVNAPDPVMRAADEMKNEILTDIECGIVPASVSSYSELHDYVDANFYGGDANLNTDVFNDASSIVDAWLKSGRA